MVLDDWKVSLSSHRLHVGSVRGVEVLGYLTYHQCTGVRPVTYSSHDEDLFRQCETFVRGVQEGKKKDDRPIDPYCGSVRSVYQISYLLFVRPSLDPGTQ